MDQDVSVSQGLQPMTTRELSMALLELTGELEKAEVLQQNVPDWLMNAGGTFLEQLNEAADEALSLQEAVKVRLSTLDDVQAFCRKHLKAALSSEFGDGFDVDEDRLWLPQREWFNLGPPLYRDVPTPARWVSHSLLEAAMQNFTQAQEGVGEDGMPAVAMLATQAPAKPSPAAFAKCCRRLDLGKRYQEHLLHVLTQGRSANDDQALFTPVARSIKQLRVAVLKMEVLIAYQKQHLSKEGYDTLQLFLEKGATLASGDVLYNAKPVSLQGLEIHGACLWGVVVFSARSVEQFPTEKCMVYMPGEPFRPVYEYAAFSQFQQYLSLKLKTKAYRQTFTHYIDEANRLDFFKALTDQAELGVIKQRPMTHDLNRFFFESLLGKLQVDSRTLAVPTADVDAEQRQKRLEGYWEAGLTLANICAMFIPVMGELMMGVTLGQLLGEIFDGYEDWQAGDKRKAFSHLTNVLANVALMAAFAKASSALKLHPQQDTADWFDGFEAVTRGGWRRLWKRNLRRYRQPIDLSDTPDSNGLYQIGDKTFVRLQGHALEVRFDELSGGWRLQPQAGHDLFAPPVELNGEGGWRYRGERPAEWDNSLYVLRRIAPDLKALSALRLEAVQDITQAPLPRLQAWARQNQPVSRRFRDQAERFILEQRIRDCIWHLLNEGQPTAENQRLLLHALPMLPAWPKHVYFELFNDNGVHIANYPQGLRLTPEHTGIRLTEHSLREDGVLGLALDKLDEQATAQLLKEAPASGTPARRLARAVADWMEKNAALFFGKLYEAYDRPNGPSQTLFKQRFAQLPVRVAQRLIDRASSVERLRVVNDQRIPMRLAQEAREMMEQVAADRACAELFLPARGLSESRLQVLQLLKRMPGWPADFALEVRDGSIGGPLLERVGPSDAKVRRIIAKQGELHEVYDVSGRILGLPTSGRQSLYDAALRALPAEQLNALGLSERERSHGFKLRNELFEHAVNDRPAVMALLRDESLDKTEPLPACVQASPPAPPVPAAHSRALVRRTRRLFPLFTETQINHFLDERGADHLERAESIKAHEQQLHVLRASLKSWTRATQGITGELHTSRLQVAGLIEDAWRRLTFVPGEGRESVAGLKLDGMRVGDLPSLPGAVKFDHLRLVSLNDMQLDDSVAYFLKAFTHVESLSLERNNITRLPEILAHMPGLKRLLMSSNALTLSEYTLKKLADMRNLIALDLSENRLGATPEVGKMLDMVHLKLRNCDLRELPVGLGRLPFLDFVDLRNNAIRQLPDWVFAAPRRIAQTINLRFNPLSSTTVASLDAYRRRTGIGMGYLHDDIAAMNESTARGIWMPESPAAHKAIWTDLKDDQRSESLFALLSELGNSADSEFVREDMHKRVWEVLEAAHDNTELRNEVFNLAANPFNCTDSAAINFSHLEVAVRVHKAGVASERGTSTAALLREGRGLFRLDELEKLAHEHSQADPSADPAEVSLAYRTGLVESLDLPGQPTHMRFAGLSGVTREDLEKASMRVRTAELSPAFMDSLTGRKFWRTHLRKRYPGRFDLMNTPFHEEQDAIMERAHSMDDAQFRREFEAIGDRREAAERTLFRELTHEEMKTVDMGCQALVD